MNSENKNQFFDDEVASSTDQSQSVAETVKNDAEVLQANLPITEEDLKSDDFTDEYETVLEPIFDSKKEKKTFSILGFGFACFTFVSILVSTIIATVVAQVAPEIYNTSLFMQSVTPISMYLFALPVLLIFLSRLPAVKPEKRKLKFGAWILFLLVGFGLMYMGSQVSTVILGLLTSILGYDPMNALDSMVANSNVWVNLVFLVVVAPVGEEFVFRKLIIDRTHKYGCFVGALFSGVVFGLMHGNLYQCFYAFALGLLLGYLYYTTGKLYLTIGIHAVINLIGGVVVGLLTDRLTAMEDALLVLDFADLNALISFFTEHWPALIATLALLVFQWGMIACAVVLPIVFRKRIVLEKGEVQIPRGKGFSTLFLSAGCIVMLALYFFEIVLSLLPT